MKIPDGVRMNKNLHVVYKKKKPKNKEMAQA